MEVCSDDDEVIEGEKSVFIEEDSSNTVDGIVRPSFGVLLGDCAHDGCIMLLYTYTA